MEVQSKWGYLDLYSTWLCIILHKYSKNGDFIILLYLSFSLFFNLIKYDLFWEKKLEKMVPST